MKLFKKKTGIIRSHRSTYVLNYSVTCLTHALRNENIAILYNCKFDIYFFSTYIRFLLN